MQPSHGKRSPGSPIDISQPPVAIVRLGGGVWHQRAGQFDPVSTVRDCVLARPLSRILKREATGYRASIRIDIDWLAGRRLRTLGRAVTSRPFRHIASTPLGVVLKRCSLAAIVEGRKSGIYRSLQRWSFREPSPRGIVPLAARSDQNLPPFTQVHRRSYQAYFRPDMSASLLSEFFPGILNGDVS